MEIQLHEACYYRNCHSGARGSANPESRPDYDEIPGSPLRGAPE